MRQIIRWAIDNTPAMNTLLVSVLVVGAVALFSLRREVFPEFDLDMILVTVPYPGASPEEVEEGICQKVEEAVRAIDGIKKQTAVAKEGAGSLVLELKTGSDSQRILNEVRSEIDRISTFPLLAEDPDVKLITLREAVIQIGVIGEDTGNPNAERELRDLAEQIRDELIRLDDVSQATIKGAKQYQIDVEIPEETLRRYGLSLQQVGGIIRRENFELPGGTIKTDAQEVLVKGDNKGVTGEQIARIPLVTQPGGTVLTVGDLGTVRDDFADVTSFTRVENQPAVVIAAEATSSEDLLAMTDAVKKFVATKQMPHGYRLETWGDRSVEVRDRMLLLGRNGLQGLLLVLLVLTLFLNVRVAFWVALGIPVSILGACAVLWYTGETLNMLTMFAFLMALGIVVDDGIVIGENIFEHRQMGKKPIRAAVDGAWEVLPSVGASVATTIIAFMPLMFVAGVMGKFIACLPVTMIAMLLISLAESMFILPCHLAHTAGHDEGRGGWRNLPPFLKWSVGLPAAGLLWTLKQFVLPFRRVEGVTDRINGWSNNILDRVAERYYLPSLKFALRNPMIISTAGFVVLMLAVALVRGGHVPFIVFPKLDSNTIEATIQFQNGTPAYVTDWATQQLERAIVDLDKKYAEEGSSILRLTRRSVGHAESREGGPGRVGDSSGSHLGSVVAELRDTSQREITSEIIIKEWRKLAKQYGSGFPGLEKLKFGAAFGGPGGTPIEFKLLAKTEDVDKLEAAVEASKQKLGEYPGVFDVDDDSRPGKWEFHLTVKDNAKAMGVPLAELAETVRASYYGEEVMRLQRGRHEVKLMVRYPREDRRSLADFDQIRIRAQDGVERPLTELADVETERGLTEINRVNQYRSITVSADVDEATANASNIVRDLRGTTSPLAGFAASFLGANEPKSSFMDELLKKYPEVHVRWEGQQEQTQESLSSLFVGFAIALVAMFVLLTVEFRSYFQPLLILAIIPFGMVGAIGGHALLGLPVTLFSMFGLVALTGVVVNDSIVLIDFINHRVRDGMPLEESLLEAGRRRLRPVLLTSITTIAGLLPLLFERSFQAQLLIPMAVSLAFGLMVSTLLVLFLVPTFYSIYGRVVVPRVTTEEEEPDSHPLLVAQASSL